MSRVTRNRSRMHTFPGGKRILEFTNGTSQTTTQTALAYQDLCTDAVGSPVVDSLFSSTQYKDTADLPYIDGSCKAEDHPNVKIINFQKWRITGTPTQFGTEGPLPAPSGWTLDLVAGTNPSRPVVTVPTLVQDLVELPAMVRQLGNLLLSPAAVATPKGVSSEYLGVKFGWLPLIDDLQKLVNFQVYANKRHKELNQLYSGRGLRRRLQFGEETKNFTNDIIVAPYGTAAIKVPMSLSVSKRSWATIRWKPTTPPSYHPSDSQNAALAQRLVFGLTPEGMTKGLWDVIPWTWLLGWYYNIGKYALANSYTVPAAHSNMCFMSQAVYEYRPGTFSVANILEPKLSLKGNLKKTIRTRQVSSSVSADFNMPLWDMSKLSVLGALFVQRFMR